MTKLRINESSAASLTVLAVAIRAFYGLAVDMPALGSAAWISVLIGCLAALPAAAAASCLRARCSVPPMSALASSHPVPAKAICAAVALIGAYDASFVTNAIAGSASYIALNSVSLFYLLFPQLALCVWCLMRGGNAIGASAGLWNRILPWLLLIVVLLQARNYQLSWLFPVFGPGAKVLLSGAMRTAGNLTLCTGLLLLTEPEPESRRNPLKTLLISAGICVFLLVTVGMMTPAMTGEGLDTRAFRLDTLLSNGRAPLSLQLPTTALWFISLFYLLLFDAFTCALALQQLVPALKNGWCIAIAVSLTVLLTVLRVSTRENDAVISSFLCIVNTAILALSMIILYRREKTRHAKT